MQTPLPALPVPKFPETPEFRPVIVIDSREQHPLVFRRLRSITYGLTSGDYSIAGLEDCFAIERKTIEDFVQCCTGSNRERFARELSRLRGYRFARLLIIGNRAQIEGHQYRSKLNPQSVLSTLGAFEARYIPVVWADTAEQAASMIESWAHWFSREALKAVAAIAKANDQSEPISTATQNPAL